MVEWEDAFEALWLEARSDVAIKSEDGVFYVYYFPTLSRANDVKYGPYPTLDAAKTAAVVLYG